jgi:hypothetical protein
MSRIDQIVTTAHQSMEWVDIIARHQNELARGLDELTRPFREAQAEVLRWQSQIAGVSAEVQELQRAAYGVVGSGALAAMNLDALIGRNWTVSMAELGAANAAASAAVDSYRSFFVEMELAARQIEATNPRVASAAFMFPPPIERPFHMADILADIEPAPRPLTRDEMKALAKEAIKEALTELSQPPADEEPIKEKRRPGFID